MPIRLNLLAEAQATEELRRRDPVKRAIWVCGTLVSLMLIWSLSIQFKAILAKQEVTGVNAEMKARAAELQSVQEDLQKLTETTNKLGRLRLLAASRLLNGSVMNAFQQCVVDDVQLTKLKIEQHYVVTEEVKAKTNSSKISERIGKPATVTERITATVDARDFSVTGDEYNKFKEKLAAHPYFQLILGKTNEVTLKNLSRPTASAEGGVYVDFSLEIRYPEKTR